MQKELNAYGIRVHPQLQEIAAKDWDGLLLQQHSPTPFMRHAYLLAMQESASATAATGWQAQFISLWQGEELVGICPVYLKDHSYGEYVFDWAWANAYHQHGLNYYPKALIAVPFTPVPGSRLLAKDTASRALLLQAVIGWCQQEKLSSLHMLFGSDSEMAPRQATGLWSKQTV